MEQWRQWWHVPTTYMLEETVTRCALPGFQAHDEACKSSALSR
jgi:hypothetical protein